MKNGWLIKAVADLCGVSVRLLHHWDEIGLVSPSERLPNGYRLYAERDIKRIQQALLYRETGMRLDQIKTLLDRPHSEAEHLRMQLARLEETALQLDQKIKAVHQLLEACMNGQNVSIEAKAALMGKDWRPDYEAEAQDKWGETTDWETAQSNLSQMTPTDWQAHRQAMQAIEAQMADRCTAGMAPDDPPALVLIEQYRQVCSKHHFEITPAKHVLLSQMYVSDPRFAAYYERYGAGFAQWICDAIEANARAHGIDPKCAEWV